FFQEFTKGLLRLLSWRLKKTKTFSLLSRLLVQNLVTTSFNRWTSLSVNSLLMFKHRFLSGFGSFLKKSKIEQLLPPPSFLFVESLNLTKTVLSSFLILDTTKRTKTEISKESFNIPLVRYRVGKRKFGWRAWFFRKSL